MSLSNIVSFNMGRKLLMTVKKFRMLEVFIKNLIKFKM